jgi:hypothetical protein
MWLEVRLDIVVATRERFIWPLESFAVGLRPTLLHIHEGRQLFGGMQASTRQSGTELSRPEALLTAARFCVYVLFLASASAGLALREVASVRCSSRVCCVLSSLAL